MKRLIEQTACEHGEYKEHVWTETGLWPRDLCPGGSSRGVTVDYEAARKPIARLASEMRMEDRGVPIRQEAKPIQKSFWREVEKVTTEAVDAALGGGR